MKGMSKLVTGLVGVMIGMVPILSSAAVIKPQVQTRSAVVVDQVTGQVLADKDGEERLPIASLSKLVVVYLVAQQLKQGKLQMEQSVYVPEKIARFTQTGNLDTVPLTSEHPYTVRDLLTAALLPSGNGAAMTLANLVATSQAAYNRRAERLLTSWGIKGVHWYSAAGLSEADLGPFKSSKISPKAENKLSAREVALVAQHLVQDFPQVVSITAQKQAQIPDLNGQSKTIKNSNQLVGNRRYQIRGLKTGQTPDNGTNLVTIAQLKRRPVITVALNTGQQGRQVVFSTTLSLLDQVQAQTKTVVLTQLKGRSTLNLLTAKNQQVPVKVAAPVTVFVARQEENEATLKLIQPAAKAKLPQAPLKKASQVGQAELVFQNKQDADFLQNQAPKPPVVTSQPVSRANWLVLCWRRLGLG